LHSVQMKLIQGCKHALMQRSNAAAEMTCTHNHTHKHIHTQTHTHTHARSIAPNQHAKLAHAAAAAAAGRGVVSRKPRAAKAPLEGVVAVFC